MITLQNYDVRKISLSAGPNESIVLTDPILLNALARPPWEGQFPGQRL